MFRKFMCFVMMGILLLTACALPQSQDEAGAEEQVAEGATSTVADANQEFVIASGNDIGELNPHNYRSSFIALDMVYEPLVRYEADGTLSPALAEEWSISEDGLTWTFKLRQGVVFHDGEPFNSAAVKWNLEHWVQTDDHSWLPTATRVESIETPDDYTVILQMNTFYYPAFQDLALVRPVRFLSPKAVDANGEFIAAIGTGPWKLESYIPQQQAVFVSNENYWGEKSSLEKVVFEVIPDAQTRIAALLSGEVDLVGGDYIGGVSLESLPVLRRNPDVQVIVEPGTNSYILHPNYKHELFDDVRVRRAFNYAIDRQAISDAIFSGVGQPAQGLFPDSIPYVNYTDTGLYHYNAELANSLLDEAGWIIASDGVREKDGQRLEISMVLDGAMFPQAKSMAQVIQSQLKDVGVDVKIQVLDYGGWLEAYGSGNYDLLMHITWGAPYDPHSSLNGMFYSKTSGGTVFFTTPELDSLIESVLAEKDETQRQVLFNKIWQILDEQAVAIPLVYSSRVYAVRSEVAGFRLGGTEYELNLQEVVVTQND